MARVFKVAKKDEAVCFNVEDTKTLEKIEAADAVVLDKWSLEWFRVISSTFQLTDFYKINSCAITFAVI